MADDNVSWEGLDLLEQGVDALVEKARKLREPRPARGRELLQVLTHEVFCNAYDYSTRAVTYYNGDDRDLVLERLTCVVYRVTSAGVYTPLVRNGGGYYPTYPLAGFTTHDVLISADRCFDFVWNYSKDATQAIYGRAQGQAAGQGLSSFVLGDVRSKRLLDFAAPLVVRKGEGIVFEVTPTCCVDSTDSTDQFSVNFIGYGRHRQPQVRR